MPKPVKLYQPSKPEMITQKAEGEKAEENVNIDDEFVDEEE